MWNFLGPAKECLKIYGMSEKLSQNLQGLTVEDQFLMTLYKMRRNPQFWDLEYTFHVKRQTLSKVFKTWLQLMFLKFKELESRMFVSSALLPKPLPLAFKNRFLKLTRCVIDCSELFLESSKDFKEQGNTYSQYKSHTTAKVLIAVAPSGSAMFVSDCFEGSISDRGITIRSGFLDFIEAGDSILADRGFNIEDLLATKGAHLNIPSFLNGRSHFTLEELKKSKVIARARVHVEHFNQRLKSIKY